MSLANWLVAVKEFERTELPYVLDNPVYSCGEVITGYY
jgi:hypothetical protein